MRPKPSRKHYDPAIKNTSRSGSKSNMKIRKMSDLFGLLGTDPEENIRIIVRQACEVLDGACSLFNRLDDKGASLTCWAAYGFPTVYALRGTPDGHICYEAAIRGQDQTVVIEDISQTPFLEIDPLVQRYGLKSYLGQPVQCGGGIIGSLAVVDTRVRHFDETDIYLISTLAKALSLEAERRKTDIALSEREAEYQNLYKMMHLLADNVPDMIWSKDMDNRYLFANQAMCSKLLKCKFPDEVIGKTDMFFVQREREAGHKHTFGEIGAESDDIVKQKRVPQRFLEEGLVRNQHLSLDIHKAPFWGPDGGMIGTVGCGRDVTNEKQIEKALQESEKRYRNLYNSTPVMLCSIDREQNLTSVSNLWLEIMGYERDEVIGRSILDFFSSESRQDVEQIYLPDLYKTGHMKNRPLKFAAKNGEIKNILFSAVAEKDNNGDYHGALAFLVDVTKANRTEIEKNRLSARLQQAQKMEAIATLAGGIAHQFNNALAVILGNLELIQMDGLYDEKINLYIEPINQASQKMVQLTGQLLAYARGGKFQTQTVEAHQFVKETLLLVQHSMAPYVELETDLDADSGFIDVDLTQMQMLLAAILSNASEAMDGQGQVRINLHHKEVTPEECEKHPGLKPGPKVMLRIIDNGQGMDEQTRNRIFEPFFTTKFQGRGLGMAAVYGITKKHGGYVYVESKLGEGTTVTVYLPGASPEKTVVEAESPYAVRRNGTALIVEDEHLVMEVNRAIVEKLGYQVLEAKSGKEAVEIAKNYDGQIDFAMLDVILPDMDGSVIYPKLMAVRPNLKVIVCSGFSLDGPARQILDSGAESFVQKPFTMAALSAVLNRIFKNQDED